VTLHSRIKRRLELSAGLTRFAAFIKVNPRLPIAGPVTQTFPVVSRAEADQVAEAWGARTTWRNGYYMAEGELAGLALEIHFAPPIRQDAA
jgi:hypothetical protein